MNATKPKTVHLLWTGGWDSTFRLMLLVLVRKVVVQPHYLIDRQRASTEVELQTMDGIRKALGARSPQAGRLVLPTRVVAVQDVAPHAGITDAFERLRRRCYLGDQYEWLPRYAEQCGLEGLELGVTGEQGSSESGIRQALEAVLTSQEIDGERIHQVAATAADAAEFELFGRFSFPIFGQTRRAMQQQAHAGGFLECLQQSWSCFAPRNGQPCGVCNPCSFTIEHGLGDRIPLWGRIRYHVSIKRRLKARMQRHPAVYRRLQLLLRSLRAAPNSKVAQSESVPVSAIAEPAEVAEPAEDAPRQHTQVCR